VLRKTLQARHLGAGPASVVDLVPAGLHPDRLSEASGEWGGGLLRALARARNDGGACAADKRVGKSVSLAAPLLQVDARQAARERAADEVGVRVADQVKDRRHGAIRALPRRG
jgi:hypothetical protein